MVTKQSALGTAGQAVIAVAAVALLGGLAYLISDGSPAEDIPGTGDTAWPMSSSPAMVASGTQLTSGTWIERIGRVFGSTKYLQTFFPNPLTK